MPTIKHYDQDDICNRSTNEAFSSVVTQHLTRRGFLQASAGLTAALAVPSSALATAVANSLSGSPTIGFTPISTAAEDTIRVPEGYSAQVLYAWGDPISAGPAFKADASNTAAEQALQAGMHHDGMAYFPLPSKGTEPANHGLLALNHEYTDDGLLHTDGTNTWTAEKVAKAQAAHGVSVIEVSQAADKWAVQRPSKYARRITANTPMLFSGPAAGHALLKTADDMSGRHPRGTFANCANGQTPWGTYLTCEENFNGYFAASEAKNITYDHERYGISAKGAGYRWHEFDSRFDISQHPTEPNRFGWVVEIDPFDPSSTPIKHTALGRVKHESAAVTVAKSGHVVVYMGDDQAFEYIYKFVSKGKFKAGNNKANRKLLEEGTLYVARFDAEGKGVWLPLVHGQRGLTESSGFPDQGSVLINTRQAADVLGATKMDRPEWITVHPQTGEVYCTLTNNVKRGNDAASDLANPRDNNMYGHIIRWRDDIAASATTFKWDIFLMAGNPANETKAQQGHNKGDAFACPDGLAFDKDSRLWIQTDVSTSVLNQGEYKGLGNNQMLCANPVTGEVKRFLTGPMGCEITGIAFTPDSKTLFINIQHPGETASERSDPSKPKAVSSWPDGTNGERPRSATIAIRKLDSGIIGS